jgi:hypothetical protein
MFFVACPPTRASHRLLVFVTVRTVTTAQFTRGLTDEFEYVGVGDRAEIGFHYLLSGGIDQDPRGLAGHVVKAPRFRG